MFDPTAEILEAISKSDLSRLRNAFAKNADQINRYTYMNGRTALGYAARHGNLEIVSYLIDVGFDINRGDRHDGCRPIADAACGDQYDVAEYLIDHGADLAATSSVQDPLFSAIVGRSPRIVELLLKAGANSLAKYDMLALPDMDAIAFAIMRGEVECAEVIAMWNCRGDRDSALTALQEAEAALDRKFAAIPPGDPVEDD